MTILLSNNVSHCCLDVSFIFFDHFRVDCLNTPFSIWTTFLRPNFKHKIQSIAYTSITRHISTLKLKIFVDVLNSKVSLIRLRQTWCAAHNLGIDINITWNNNWAPAVLMCAWNDGHRILSICPLNMARAIVKTFVGRNLNTY